jgi:methyl-accepting chemotaxis protein
VNTNTALVIFVGVTAAAFVGQLFLLYFLLRAIRDSSARLENIANRLEERTTPVLATAHAILEQAEPRIEEITNNLAEASATVRTHVADLAQATGEIVERARVQAAHVDEVIHSTVERISQTSIFLQDKVITPVRRVQAIVSAVSAGVGFLKRVRSHAKGPQLAPTDDEEMFI